MPCAVAEEACFFPFAAPPRRFLQTALEHAVGSLVHYRHTHTLAGSELPVFKACVRCMLELALPYLAASFGRVFSAQSVKVDVSSASALLRQLVSEL
jgi:hypothetical protein